MEAVVSRRKRHRPARRDRASGSERPETLEDVLRMRRSGQGVWVQRTSPDVATVEAALGEEAGWLETLPAHVTALEGLFAGHDAFDLLAALLVLQAEHRSRPPQLRDTFLDGLMAGETAAMVLVERPRRAGTGAPQVALGDAIAAAVPHLRELTTHASSVLSRLWHRGSDDALAAMQERFVRRYMFVPINETDEQAQAWLRELFGDPEIEEWLVREVGFGVADAERLVTGAIDLMVEHSRDLSLDSGPGVGEVLALSITELAARAKVDARAATAFCARLSQPFGQKRRAWPALPTPLRHRPLVDDGAGRYLLAAPPMLRRGLRHALAAALNPVLTASGPGDKVMYQRYLARRGALVESRALAPLRACLKPQFMVQNLHFTVHGQTRLEGEIDGLLVIDHTAIVLQAKSAPTRIDALAGDPDGFAAALRDIVKESMRQHDDARAALRARREDVTFWIVEEGRRVSVDVPDLGSAEILPLTVTLEDLSGCAPASWELHEAGLATSDELPWIVGATPLETMISLLCFGAQFVQFLRRRSLLNESRNLDASDEIDIFLEYLHDHLEIVYARRKGPEGPVAFMPPERFHDLDRWLQAQRARDSRVKPPRQKLHRSLQGLLERLERDRPPGWLDASVAALDVPKRYHKHIGAMANAALTSKSSRPLSGSSYVTLAGETLAFVLIREPRGAHLDDTRSAKKCRDQARRENATALVAFVVPEDRSEPLRTLWSGPIGVDC